MKFSRGDAEWYWLMKTHRILLALSLTISCWFCPPSELDAQMITFTNPTPASGDAFGITMAAVGLGKVIIGAPGDEVSGQPAGSAHLFDTNGALLVTFTNPTPAYGDGFGYAVAAVGTDRVIIGAFGSDMGATNAGAAFLFSTNGTLLTTFTNPSPTVSEGYGDRFGYSVAALGSDRILIGAPLKDTSGEEAGAVYLFSTNGTLLLTFTNAGTDGFGQTLAAVGSDHVLIGSPGDHQGAGAAYLFNTNGVPLITFTKPLPQPLENFGYSLAAVGTDKVLIGTYQARTAYLFSTNGALLATFTDPIPAFGVFGISVAAVGSDQVLIGAVHEDVFENSMGAAFLFSLDGTLRMTFTNQSQASGESFGRSVAAAGSGSMIIGAPYDDMGTPYAGVAYLFSLPAMPPTLAITPMAPGQATVSWTSQMPGFVLQETSSLSPTNWLNSPSGATNPIVVPTTLPTKYYRLFKP